MLEDRDYMRQQSSFEPRISFTVGILIVNAIVFLVHLAGTHGPNPLRYVDTENTYFALSLSGIQHGYLWQLLTFQFMHSGWMHILFNSLAIFFFGRSVETAIGGMRLLTLYFSSGIIGGGVQLLFFLITHSQASVVGASAGAFGLVGAFALLAWNEQFTILLYFLIPININGKILFWVSAAMAGAGMALPSTVANAAHLGGILAGAAYVLLIVQGRLHFPQWQQVARTSTPRELAARHAGKKASWNSQSIPPAEDLTPDEFLQKEVDPILDKISARGIQSLTAREREILEKARSKMNRR